MTPASHRTLCRPKRQKDVPNGVLGAHFDRVDQAEILAKAAATEDAPRTR